MNPILPSLDVSASRSIEECTIHPRLTEKKLITKFASDVATIQNDYVKNVQEAKMFFEMNLSTCRDADQILGFTTSDNPPIDTSPEEVARLKDGTYRLKCPFISVYWVPDYKLEAKTISFTFPYL